MTNTKTPGYNSWVGMRQRCYYKGHKDYEHYGGRGITVCDRWRISFTSFIEDMGERPEGMTLDRINTNGNYEPSNCRWATSRGQILSRRFFVHPPRSKTPYISRHSNGTSYQLTITITKKNVFHKSIGSLADAEALRDICVFERDFLRLRGLTYD